MPVPSLENLRCFIAAASSPTFRAAAKQVGLTSTALGQRIRQLEEQVEVQLFRRTTRSLALTTAGLALLPAARAAIEAAAHCLSAAKGVVTPMSTELTVGSRFELGLSFVIPLHAQMLRSHPGLSLHYYFGSGPDLLLRVRAREIDVAISSSRLGDPWLSSIRLHREDYVLVGATSLLRKRPLRRPEEAASHVLIDVDASMPLFRYWRDAPGGGDRLRFKSVWCVGLGEAVRRLVLAGEGVAVKKEFARGQLVQLFPKVAALFDHFQLVFRADDPRRALYEALSHTYLSADLH